MPDQNGVVLTPETDIIDGADVAKLLRQALEAVEHAQRENERLMARNNELVRLARVAVLKQREQARYIRELQGRYRI